ncbi:MAG: hydrogenase maturation protease [Methylocystis sp.]
MQDGMTMAIQSSPAPVQSDLQNVLVLGLGNTLLCDDGVGVHVARKLARDPNTPAGLRAIDGGTLGFRLMAELTRSDAVLIIDAAQFGASSGTLRLLDQDALREHVQRGGRMSAHEAGLSDMLTMAWLEGWAPVRLALLGIQPQRIDWGEQLSESVAKSVPAACRAIVRTILTWQARP